MVVWCQEGVAFSYLKRQKRKKKKKKKKKKKTKLRVIHFEPNLFYLFNSSLSVSLNLPPLSVSIYGPEHDCLPVSPSVCLPLKLWIHSNQEETSRLLKYNEKKPSKNKTNKKQNKNNKKKKQKKKPRQKKTKTTKKKKTNPPPPKKKGHF